ncbi:MAG: cytochrome C, partial [Alphaproteobacteria bacterium HGW-Alphaproteobacteria-2]
MRLARPIAAAFLLAALPSGGTLAQALVPSVLEGHGGPVMAIDVLPDGEEVLSGSFDNSVGLWDLSNGAVRWLEGHEAAVKAILALGPGRAASGGDDFAVHLWDTHAGRSLARLEGHKGQVAALAVSPAGDLLASAGWDGWVGLWSLPEGAHLGFLKGHRAQVTDVTFSPDGAYLYSASADGTIRLWSVVTRSEERVIVNHGFGVTRLRLGPGAEWLAYGAVDGGTRVVRLSDGAELADLTLDRRPILALALSDDATRLAVGDGEGHVMMVDTADWSILQDIRVAERGPVWALDFLPGHDGFYAGGMDDALYHWPEDGGGLGPRMGLEAREFHKAAGSMGNGERQFRRKCAICHTLGPDSARRAGPTLYRLFGRRAGSVPGYGYSAALDGSPIVWSEDTIDRLFDLGPDHYVPGTKMPMQRITRAEDRR